MTSVLTRLALATAVLTVVAAGVAVAHRTAYPTSSSFGYDPAREDFLGEVNFPAGRRECAPQRRVRLFRVRPGDDPLVGATRSGTSPGDSPGYWVIRPRSVPSGRYYAKVLRRDLASGSAHTHLCRAYRTSAIPAG